MLTHMRSRLRSATLLSSSIALLVLASSTALTSCHAFGHTRQIALITPTATTELWKGMHAGAYKAAREEGVRLYWNGATQEGDVERQIEIVERKVRQCVAGIVLVPAHASQLISAIAEARDANVPVALAATRLAEPLPSQVPTVMNNEEKTGELAADYIARLVPSGEVAIVGVSPSNSSTLERVRAFENAMRRYPDRTIVERSYTGPNSFFGGEFDPALLLNRHPDLRAIFSPTLEGTRVAYALLRQNKGAGRIHLVVCEQDAEEFEPLRRGEIDAIVAIDVFQIGYRATRLLLHPHDPTTAVHQVVDPILVTWSNVQTPAIQHALRPYAGFDR